MTAGQVQEYLKTHPVSKGPTGFEFHPSPPCSRTIMTKAESELGFSLPALLRDIYLTVANGGFGPGYGIMGVNGGFTDDRDNTVEKLYAIYRNSDPEDPSWEWPEGWLPMCYWGCVVYSVVDCLHEPFPVYFVDIDHKLPGERMDSIIHFHKRSLEEWLSDWMTGKDLWKEYGGSWSC